MKKGMRLIDGVAHTWGIPNESLLDALAPGAFVKLGVEGFTGAEPINAERFWVLLTSIVNGIYRGKVTQAALIYTDLHGVKHDSYITFERRHILAIE